MEHIAFEIRFISDGCHTRNTILRIILIVVIVVVVAVVS